MDNTETILITEESVQESNIPLKVSPEEIFNCIFKKSKNASYYLPIITPNKKISDFLKILYTTSPIEEKNLTSLSSLIEHFPFSAKLFQNIKISNYLTLYEILCFLYIHSNNQNVKDKLINIISLMNKEVVPPESVYNYIYRNLSKLWRNKELNKENIIDSLNLLQVLYKKNFEEDMTEKEYMFFTGNGELKLKFEPIQLNLGIMVYLNIFLEYNEEDLDPNSIEQPILIELKGEIRSSRRKIPIVFTIELENFKEILIKVNDRKLEKYAKCTMNLQNWENIVAIFKENLLMIRVSNKLVIFPINELKWKRMNNEFFINEINLFRNFYGKCTFVKIEPIEKENNIEIFQNCEYLEFKSISEYNMLFYPSGYNGIYFEGLKNSSKAYFSYPNDCEELNGVNIFNEDSEHIILHGGFNNLLPIIEIIVTYNNGEFLREENNEIFGKYIKLIANVITSSNNNLLYANQVNFFPCLSLFLEKIPSYLYTREVFVGFSELISFLSTKIDQLLIKNNFSPLIDNIFLNEKIIFKFSNDHIIMLWKEIAQTSSSEDSLINLTKICALLRVFDKARYEEYCCEEHRTILEGNKNSDRKVMNPEMNRKLEGLCEIIKRRVELNENYENILLFKLLASNISPCIQKKILEVFINHFKLKESEGDNEDEEDDYYQRKNEQQGKENEEKEKEIDKLAMDNETTQKKRRNWDEIKFMIEEECFDIILYLFSFCLIDIKKKLIRLIRVILEEYFDELKVYLEKEKNEKDFDSSLQSKFEYFYENVLYDFILLKDPRPKNIIKIEENFIELKSEEKQKRPMNLLLNDSDNSQEENQIVNMPSLTTKNSKKTKIEFTYNYNIKADSENEFNTKKEEEENKESPTLTEQNINEGSIDFSEEIENNQIINTIVSENVTGSQELKINGNEPKMPRRLIINTDLINDESNEHEMQKEKKISLLAQHCINYIEEKDTKQQCHDPRFDQHCHLNELEIGENITIEEEKIKETLNDKEDEYFAPKYKDETSLEISFNNKINSDKANLSSQNLIAITRAFRLSLDEDKVSVKYTKFIIGEDEVKLKDILEKNELNKQINAIYNEFQIILFFFVKNSFHKKKGKFIKFSLELLLNTIIKLLSSSNRLDLNCDFINKLYNENIYKSNPNLLGNTKFKTWIFEMMFIIYSVQNNCFINEQYNQIDSQCCDNIWDKVYEFFEYLFFNQQKEKISHTYEGKNNCFNKQLLHCNFSLLKGLINFLIYIRIILNDNNSHLYEITNKLLNKIFTNLSNQITAPFKDDINIFIKNFENENIKSYFEFINIFHNFSFLFKISHNLVSYFNLDEQMIINCEYDIFPPQYFFEGTEVKNFNFSENSYLEQAISELWPYYNIYNNLFKVVSQFWLSTRWVPFTQVENDNDDEVEFDYAKIGEMQYFIIFSSKGLEMVVENIIFQQKCSFSNEIKILLYKTNNNLSLIQIINNYFIFVVSVAKNSQILQKELIKYQDFLYYCFLVFLREDEKEKKNEDKQNFLPTLLWYNITFLIKQSFFNNDSELYPFFKIVLINIIRLLSEVKHKIEKNKKKKKTLFQLFKKDNQFDNFPFFNFYRDNININNSMFLDEQSLIRFKYNYNEIDEHFTNHLDFIEDNFFKNDVLRGLFCDIYFDIKSIREQFKQIAIAIKNIIPLFNYEGIMEKEINCGLNLKTSSNYCSEKFLKEKTRLSYSITQIILNFGKTIQRASTNLLSDMKKKIKQYKTIKKELFCWNGGWSEHETFFTEEGNKRLKFKHSNHLTKELSKPLISPVLDVFSYLPKFKNFNPKDNLFDREISDKYKIYIVDLNIEAMLSEKNDLNNESGNEQKDKKEFNYIYKIYNQNSEIWRCYEKLDNNISINEDNMFKVNRKVMIDNIEDNLKVKRRRSALGILKNKITDFECCYIKQSHHIKGVLSLKNDYLTFSVSYTKSKEDMIKDEDYDNEKELCYGSYFPIRQNDYEKCLFSLNITDIHLIFKRNYFHKKNALEIFTNNNRTHFFQFKKPVMRNVFLKQILECKKRYPYKEIKIDGRDKMNNENIIGYILGVEEDNIKKYPYSSLSNLLDQWTNCTISNFEFLMWLNVFGGRSYRDLFQYPIFPWVFKDNEFISYKNNNFRSFDIPIGMLDDMKESAPRIMNYKKNFKIMINELMQQYDIKDESEIDEILETGKLKNGKKIPLNKIPYYYGSHYSNSTYVSHYMMRLFPYSQILIEIQGKKFDDPNRLFSNITNSFKCANIHCADLRELIPEFFYLPEMFININNYYFGIVKDEDNVPRKINDVIFPSWCTCNPELFLVNLRSHFEYGGNHLGDWIDLIFGVNQRGKKAREKCNLFLPYSYEHLVKREEIDDVVQKEFVFRLVEIGLTPHQVLFKEMPKERKITKDIITKNLLKEVVLQSKGLSDIVPVHVALGGKTRIIIIDKDFNLYLIELSELTFDKPIKVKAMIKMKTIPKLTKIFKYHKYYIKGNKTEKSPNAYYTYREGNYTAIGGFLEGSLLVISKDQAMDVISYNKDRSFFLKKNPVTFITMDKEEKFAFCGTEAGILFIFKLIWIPYHSWEIIFNKHIHSKRISYIYVNWRLNIFGTCAYDGYINLYTFPKITNYRSIYIPNFTIDNLFISSYPIATVIAYSSQLRNFKCYNINGKLLNNCNLKAIIKENFGVKGTLKFPREAKNGPEGELISPFIYTSKNFQDYLIYSNQEGYIMIRKLPFMEIKNFNHDKIENSNVDEENKEDQEKSKKEKDTQVFSMKDIFIQLKEISQEPKSKKESYSSVNWLFVHPDKESLIIVKEKCNISLIIQDKNEEEQEINNQN